MNGPTPGPWHKSKTHLGKAYDIGADNGANIALVYGPGDGGPDEGEANADLFVASERVLAALRRLVRGYDEETGTIDASAEHYCQECTGGLTPAKFDKGPCPYHEALAALTAAGVRTNA